PCRARDHKGPAPAATRDPRCGQSRALARSARGDHLLPLRDVVARPSSSSPFTPAQTPRKRLRLGASLASAAPIGVAAPRAPLVIGGLLATALRLRRVWPLVLGSPAMPEGPAYHPPMRTGCRTGRRASGEPPIGTAILSYFTLPNSNHERKSSPIEKIVFCIRSFLTRCLKNDRSKFTGHAPLISNSSAQSAVPSAMVRWLRAFRSS